MRWVARFDFPDFERDYEFVSLQHPSEYPLCEGKVVSCLGLDLTADRYDAWFAEEHVRHSNSLRSVIRERGNYMVGPLARYSLNFDRLTPLARKTAGEIKLQPPVKNPFKSIVVRAIETHIRD